MSIEAKLLTTKERDEQTQRQWDKQKKYIENQTNEFTGKKTETGKWKGGLQYGTKIILFKSTKTTINAKTVLIKDIIKGKTNTYI